MNQLELARLVPLVILAGRALTRPRLVPALLLAGWRFRARHWYRRPPFLPIPPARYLEWRLFTAYGNDRGRLPSATELERYLRWTRRMSEKPDVAELYQEAQP